MMTIILDRIYRMDMINRIFKKMIEIETVSLT